MNEPPDFATLARHEDAALAAKLEAVRAVLKHPGEKGRVLEQAVLHLLRDLLHRNMACRAVLLRSTPMEPSGSRRNWILSSMTRCGRALWRG